jgi:DNA mismatch repair protein MutS
MEDPRFTKKLVKREIARVITPGTATEANLLRSHENNYLAAVICNGTRAGVAHVDVSTGEFRTTEMEASDVTAALENLNAREVLHPEKSGPDTQALRTPVEPWVFDYDYGDRSLREHFGLHSLDGCGLGGKPLAVQAAGAVLHYLRDTQRSALDHLDRPSFYDRAGAMILDAVTVRNLELTEPLFAGERSAFSILSRRSTPLRNSVVEYSGQSLMSRR